MVVEAEHRPSNARRAVAHISHARDATPCRSTAGSNARSTPRTLARRLRAECRGDDPVRCALRGGRYATDASIYQIDARRRRRAAQRRRRCAPPSTICARARRAGAAARRGHVAVRADGRRGAGRSITASISTAIVALRPRRADGHGRARRRARSAQRASAAARPLVSRSTSARRRRRRIGGMAGNNSCGSRSIAYGNMVHNVLAIDALLADGTEVAFGPTTRDGRRAGARARAASRASRRSARASTTRSRARCPTLLRRVGGYNIDVFNPQSVRPYTADGSVNLAHLLVGSEGTLAWSRALTLKLAPLPGSIARSASSTSRRSIAAMECARSISSRSAHRRSSWSIAR